MISCTYRVSVNKKTEVLSFWAIGALVKNVSNCMLRRPIVYPDLTITSASNYVTTYSLRR